MSLERLYIAIHRNMHDYLHVNYSYIIIVGLT